MNANDESCILYILWPIDFIKVSEGRFYKKKRDFDESIFIR